MRLDVKPSLRELVGGAARRSGRSTSPCRGAAAQRSTGKYREWQSAGARAERGGG